MSMVWLVDKAPGETRAGRFDEDGRALALYVDRAFEHKTRACMGALYCGRVRAVDKALDAAFVDLGLGAPGFLPLRRAPEGLRVHEGAALAVVVHREAIAEKGPQLAFAADQALCAGRDCPGLLQSAPDFVQSIRAKGDRLAEADRAGRARLDDAFDAALDPHVPLHGGGTLWIEPTRALVAIDVDTGGAAAQKVNEQAITQALHEIRLRRLGGIIAIDFAPMKGARARKDIETLLAQALDQEPEPVALAPMSRFGVALFSRRRSMRSLAEIMLDETGQASVPTLALAALRMVENEHRANPARALCLDVSPALHHWLHVHQACWHDDLLARLGGRLEMRENAALACDQFEVMAR